jgi:hypothetical protein
MSIIVALISSRAGIVGSDGRLFSSAEVAPNGGRTTEPVKVTSDEFDKTFALAGGEIIGAACGLMGFSGLTIAQHVAQIVGPVLPVGCQFGTLVDQITAEMIRRLTAEPCVAFPRRRGELLLVAGEPLVRSGVSIAAVQFTPENNLIKPTTDFIPAERHSKPLVYKIYGDANAEAAARSVFRENRAPNKDVIFLKALAERVIRAGIRASGVHPDGSDPGCGGRVFTRTTISVKRPKRGR